MLSFHKSQIIKKNEFKKTPGVIKAALVGNPNVGKTTLFNRLTGSAQYVGNWPGVTVERKEGTVRDSRGRIEIVDLPGVYSLSPFSSEEIITRNYILENNADLIINIIDATNIERNLYLTTQLLEFDAPVLIVLNMSDLLKRRGKIINFCEFENIIGVSVVSISAVKNFGIESLIDKIFDISNNKFKSENFDKFKRNIYGSDIENKINKIRYFFNNLGKKFKNERFIFLKILENDQLVISSLKLNYENIKQINAIRISNTLELEEKIAKERYAYAIKICSKIIIDESKIQKTKISRKIDKIITGKYTAIPIFLFIVIAIFYSAFGPMGSFLENSARFIITHGIAEPIKILLNQIGANYVIQGFVSAVLNGIGEVIAFLPQILILFGALSLLEDSGYMARGAFIIDSFMRKIGLSGKAFVPLVMGFGCNVPAILSTRILENKNEKKMAIFLIPFMSCGAKMPVYLLFINIFFPNHKVLVLISIYFLGIVLATLSSLLFKRIFFDPYASFIMELPDYKWPSLQNLYLHVWERTKDFLERAGTLIFGSVIIVWFLQSFNLKFKFIQDSSQSILAFFGNLIAPIFRLCGFGNWKASVSLLTGMISKETIVSTMAVVYGSEELTLKKTILQEFSASAAIAFLVFVLIYLPCISAISVMRKELGSRSLTILALLYQTSIAWLVSVLVFQFSKYFLLVFRRI
ncbi:MAG: ferrous iron transport protein B [Oscillospiraceae bacterium]|jgi:ferrous iron transport protein B|nr:ferrous iron transport protein B [Oscillospiraceae bacterium]